MSEENKEIKDVNELREEQPDTDGTQTAEEPAAEPTAEQATAEQGEASEEPMRYYMEESPSEKEEATPPSRSKRAPKRLSLTAFIVSAIALVLAAVMVTYTCCNSAYKKQLAELQLGQTGTAGNLDRYYPFELFDMFLETYSFEETDEQTRMTAALKAYMYATGDEYAEYYTKEEYATLMQSTAGNSEGIGVNIINTTAQVNGAEYKVIRIIHVMKDSPAEEADLRTGDLIFATGVGEARETVQTIGYDVAITRLQGAAGTQAEFTVLRPKGDGYETLEFSILRGKVTTSSVYFHKHAADPSVGVVKILQFDLTTPQQFSEAVDTLKSQGCTKFVFDVRYNPGGDLQSIQAVLSYFLQEGDVLIRTKQKSGEEEVSTVAPVTHSGDYEGCSILKEDIGKYKDLKAVVLCNASTASAAELFVATFRDYELAPIVGTVTFGKGSMQSIISLERFGYSGALKLTTAMYYPASGEGYDGVGITPDVVEELDTALADVNIYEIEDEQDNQLKKALEQFD
ncbi:MAG: hypothetical protein E7668_06015 [Ruminococcaceae bacterium]|nr:hypothetical protein [Oscillospiraceae bacterium]